MYLQLRHTHEDCLSPEGQQDFFKKTYPRPLRCTYHHPQSCPLRALHEASWMRDGMRRLRPCLASTAPGRLGQPSAPTTWGCLQWLDAGRMNGGGSRRDQGPTGALSGPGSTVPRCEIAAAVRREATRSALLSARPSAFRWRHLRPLVCAQAWLDIVRFSALRSLILRGMKYGRIRRRHKKYGVRCYGYTPFVPAKAGTRFRKSWIPAFAGMSGRI
jgi:hypothetical protein